MKMKTPAQMWEEKQKDLDETSRLLVDDFEHDMLQDRVCRLSPNRKAIHEKYNHDPKYCRCFDLDGV